MRRLLGLALLGMTLAGCGEDTPGTIVVSLESPNADDGAVLFRIIGPGIASAIGASTAFDVHVRLVSTTEAMVFLVGNVSDGPVLTLEVPNVGEANAYTGTVLDAANRADASQGSTASYAVTFEKL
ncbi:MAG: hypothetical protein ACE5FJ_01305 [Gemmatimonadales bacterium]